MIEIPTLKVLAEAAEIGLPEAATVPAAAFDPILRPFIVKRVRRAIERASARTTSRHPDHTLRLAFLDCHPQAPRDLSPDDERAVLDAWKRLAPPYLPHADAATPAQPAAGAYRQAADRDGAPILDLPKRKKERWPVTTPALMAIAAGAVATTAALVVPRLIPTPAERFAKTPFGKALVVALADEVSARSPQGNPGARAVLLSDGVTKQLGPDGAASLRLTLEAVAEARSSPEPSTDAAFAPLFRTANDLDAKLLTRGVPAYLHVYGSGRAGHRSVWLTAYFVERRDEIVFDGAPMKAVWGRRLDNLNLVENTIYKANAEEWAVLSLDKLEIELVQTLLAPMAKGAPLAPNEHVPEGSARAELSRVAGRVIAEEVRTAGGVSAADAASLHAAIAKRDELATSLDKKGYRLAPSSAIELPRATRDRVERAKEANPRDAALLQDFLRAGERAASYRREMKGALAILGRFTELELAGLLRDEKKVPMSTERVDDEGRTPRARLLVSTWLTDLANETSCPKLALWRSARNIFDAQVGDLDTSASVLALDAVLRALGLESRPEPYVDEATYAALAKALELPGDKLRDAARRAHQDLFGVPAPGIGVRTL
ncbi:MAG: hypothetical protein JST00_11710 [Deltaproteobacteria bacterium]|nr:hypothetical protein [Deltaproteobacteria bacterium]